MDEVFHYPPELLTLMTDAIGNLVKGKTHVIKFFQGAGVSQAILAPWIERIRLDRKSVYKTEIAREVLCKLNELGDSAIRPRRQVLKCIVEWEDFSTAYPENRLAAQGLVANIQKVVNIKDSFTRMRAEKENERLARQAGYIKQQQAKQTCRDARIAVKQKLYSLFGVHDPHTRGKALEAVLNELFETQGILVREAFTLRGAIGEGIVEQIDGLVELDGSLYMVEMKWHKEPVGRPDISPHLVSIYSREAVRGLFISASGFTAAAISDAKSALVQKVCVLMELEEIVALLETETELKDLLRKKVVAAQVDKLPFLKILK